MASLEIERGEQHLCRAGGTAISLLHSFPFFHAEHARHPSSSTPSPSPPPLPPASRFALTQTEAGTVRRHVEEGSLTQLQ